MAKILVLLGPTAVGKTACIQKIASDFGAVLLADTACLYKNLHIGTAKPNLQERAGFPHYFIDLLNLDESFDAGMFYAQAEVICAQYPQKPVILSGGTLFYIQNFLFGLSQAPPAHKETRTYWQKQLADQGIEALRAYLQHVDPITAAKVKPNDSYRITRALEIYTDTGRGLSTFALPNTLRPEHDWLIVQLHCPREELYRRINQRVETMWRQGLPDEIDNLIHVHGAQADWPAMKAIGYKEFFLNLPHADAIKEQIKLNTRHYAKRQETFLKRLPVQFFCPAEDCVTLRCIVKTWLQS